MKWFVQTLPVFLLLKSKELCRNDHILAGWAFCHFVSPDCIYIYPARPLWPKFKVAKLWPGQSMLNFGCYTLQSPMLPRYPPQLVGPGLAFPPNAVVAMLSYRSTGDFRPSKSPSTERFQGDAKDLQTQFPNVKVLLFLVQSSEWVNEDVYIIYV